MTERDVKELLGHMVLEMRAAEMERDRLNARIAELEAEMARPKEKKK